MWRCRSAGVESWTGRTQLVLLVLLATLSPNVAGDWKKSSSPFDTPPILFELTEPAEQVQDDHPHPLTDCLLHDSLFVPVGYETDRQASFPRVCLLLGHSEAQLPRGPPA